MINSIQDATIRMETEVRNLISLRRKSWYHSFLVWSIALCNLFRHWKNESIFPVRTFFLLNISVLILDVWQSMNVLQRYLPGVWKKYGCSFSRILRKNQHGCRQRLSESGTSLICWVIKCEIVLPPACWTHNVPRSWPSFNSKASLSIDWHERVHSRKSGLRAREWVASTHSLRMT